MLELHSQSPFVLCTVINSENTFVKWVNYFPYSKQKVEKCQGDEFHVWKSCIILVAFILSEREEEERIAREKREKEEAEYQERLKKLNEIEERKRQREREIEERQKREEMNRHKDVDRWGVSSSVSFLAFTLEVVIQVVCLLDNVVILTGDAYVVFREHDEGDWRKSDAKHSGDGGSGPRPWRPRPTEGGWRERVKVKQETWEKGPV